MHRLVSVRQKVGLGAVQLKHNPKAGSTRRAALSAILFDAGGEVESLMRPLEIFNLNQAFSLV